jgi:hypothetical protein
MGTMTHYVGAITAGRQRAQDGHVACSGYDMDNARGVKFWVSAETLSAYFADTDEDAYIVVEDSDITWLAKRDGGRSLWSTAGLPMSIG